MGLTLNELIVGFILLIFGAVLFLILPFSRIVRLYVIAVVIIVLMFFAMYQFNGKTIFAHLVLIVKNSSYTNRQLIYYDKRIKEVKHVSRKNS